MLDTQTEQVKLFKVAHFLPSSKSSIHPPSLHLLIYPRLDPVFTSRPTSLPFTGALTMHLLRGCKFSFPVSCVSMVA